jgi:hypothetical protein
MSESSGLPPEQEAVRRLLADARHDGPPPPDVVARLDETLASLVSERASEPTSGPTSEPTAGRTTDLHDRSPGRVVDLGSRRRRVASIGLLAAASVVVAGVALGQALPRGSDESGDSATSSQSDTSLAESSEAGGSSADSSTGSGSEQGGGSGAASEPAPESLKSSPATPFAGVPSLSTVDPGLDDQVLALRAKGSTRRQQLATLDTLRGCDVPRAGRAAALVAAEVDGRDGVVVFRRPVGEAQGVELYVCGEADPVRTITLPAP